jgi:hypothetical protein
VPRSASRGNPAHVQAEMSGKRQDRCNIVDFSHPFSIELMQISIERQWRATVATHDVA